MTHSLVLKDERPDNFWVSVISETLDFWETIMRNKSNCHLIRANDDRFFRWQDIFRFSKRQRALEKLLWLIRGAPIQTQNQSHLTMESLWRWIGLNPIVLYSYDSRDSIWSPCWIIRFAYILAYIYVIYEHHLLFPVTRKCLILYRAIESI